MIQYAPIVLFTYSRPTETLKTLKKLQKNILANQSTLYIFSDGPKPNATPATLEGITAVRKLIQREQWCKEVKIIERKENRGLAINIMEGVKEIVEKHGKVIVLEDDLETSPYFLQFMNDGLNLYEAEEKVLSVGACNYFNLPNDTSDSFFFRVPDCLGWATWKDRWSLFEEDSQKLITQIKAKGLAAQFDLDGNYPFSRMLQKQADNIISSWAVRWYAVSLLHQKINLYPKYSLTNHIGIGAGATHSSEVDYSSNIELATRPIKVEKIPIQEEPSLYKKIAKAYRKNYYKGIKGNIKRYYHLVTKTLN